MNWNVELYFLRLRLIPWFCNRKKFTNSLPYFHEWILWEIFVYGGVCLSLLSVCLLLKLTKSAFPVMLGALSRTTTQLVILLLLNFHINFHLTNIISAVIYNLWKMNTRINTMYDNILKTIHLWVKVFNVVDLLQLISFQSSSVNFQRKKQPKVPLFIWTFS